MNFLGETTAEAATFETAGEEPACRSSFGTADQINEQQALLKHALPTQALVAEHCCEGELPFRSLHLSGGGCLDHFRIAYQLHGKPGRPLVCVLGGISANRKAFLPAGGGWWQSSLAHSPLVDPEKYQVLTLDYLGGGGDSTGGHAVQQVSGFTQLRAEDQAAVLARTLDALQLKTIHSLIGASYGGMVAQQFAIDYPKRLASLVLLNCAHRSSALATAWRHIQREIIRLGDRTGSSEEALRLARALAIITYRGNTEFDQRFGDGPGTADTLSSYLEYQSRDIAARLDPAAYLCLSSSIDAFSIKPEAITVPCTVVSTDSDQLVTPSLIEEFCRRAPILTQHWYLKSSKGHDAFLAEPEQVNTIFNELF